MPPLLGLTLLLACLNMHSPAHESSRLPPLVAAEGTRCELRPPTPAPCISAACRALDCVALLVLEMLPSLAEAVRAYAPTLEVYRLWEVQCHMLRLLCLLLRTKQTQALARAHGAGAAVCRTLADALVMTKAGPGLEWAGSAGWSRVGGPMWKGPILLLSSDVLTRASRSMHQGQVPVGCASMHGPIGRCSRITLPFLTAPCPPQESVWAADTHEDAWMYCSGHLREANLLLAGSPYMVHELAADSRLVRQVVRAAAAVLEAAEADPVEVYCACCVHFPLGSALGLEAATAALSAGDFEARRRQTLALLLPALQAAAAAAEGRPEGSVVARQPAADAPAPLGGQQLALRQARALGTARRCGNLRCSNLAGVSEAHLRTRKCSGCHTVRFCSAGCSKAAWRTHKVGVGVVE